MKKLVLLLTIGFLTASCAKDNHGKTNKPGGPSPLIIKSGEICGWCWKDDTLTITAQHARMKTYKACDSLVKDTTAILSIQQRSQLLNKLNIQNFTALQLNSCAVCYDGCDRWIQISNDTLSHHIRFVPHDTAAIQSIGAFVYALDSLTRTLE